MRSSSPAMPAVWWAPTLATRCISTLCMCSAKTLAARRALARLVCHAAGAVRRSADRRRALLADPANARAVEIRLSDANVLNVFRQVHDLSSLTGFPDELTKNAWLFHFHGIHYADRGGQAKR